MYGGTAREAAVQVGSGRGQTIAGKFKTPFQIRAMGRPLRLASAFRRVCTSLIVLAGQIFLEITAVIQALLIMTIKT